MKILLIIVVVLVAIFIIAQFFITSSVGQTETHKYSIIKTYDGFEVRQYDPAIFSYVTMPENSYKESSGKGFRTLAGYIFGGNENEEKISMTSPVTMNIEDSTTMMFMVPSKYNMEKLPKPNDPNIHFKKVESKVVAAITFSGWANDEKIQEYSEKLKKMLDEKNIKYKGNFSFLGYNPPFDIINRRNEVIVELTDYQ